MVSCWLCPDGGITGSFYGPTGSIVTEPADGCFHRNHSNQANRSATYAMIHTTPSARPERSIQLGSERQHPARASVVQAIKTPKPTLPVVGQKYSKLKQRMN